MNHVCPVCKMRFNSATLAACSRPACPGRKAKEQRHRINGSSTPSLSPSRTSGDESYIAPSIPSYTPTSDPDPGFSSGGGGDFGGGGASSDF
jgi:uncharacterized membrane protein YgcG